MHIWDKIVYLISANSQVNRIREFPQNSKIVATHTDSPEVGSLDF